MTAVLGAWLAEIVIISWRDIRNQSNVAGLPPAGDYLATFVIFGALALVPKDSQGAKVAGATAWGFVAATALNFFDPTKPTKLGKAKVKAAQEKAGPQ